MELYLVTPAPGSAVPPAFVTARDEANRRAHEVGGTFTPVEVPNTKKDFVPWANEFIGGLVSRAPEPESVEPAAAPDRCQVCKRTGSAQHRLIIALDREAVVSKILQGDAHDVSAYLGAGLDRLHELKGYADNLAASSKGGQG